MRSDGITGHVPKQIYYKFAEIARNCGINDPEQVKGYIATAGNQITAERALG